MEYLILNNSKIPLIGLGTYKIVGDDLCYETIDNALKIGYRLFDTAQVYKNEESIGKSLEILLPKYNLNRKDIFITTKIATYNHGDKCLASIHESLSKLKTSYIDLILIHWPGSKGLKPENAENCTKRRETWKCLEQVKQQGLVNLIGVSNYNIKHLNELLTYSNIKPDWLQSEYHPFLIQTDLVDFCKQNSIIFQAYSSLGTSDSKLNSNLLQNEQVLELAHKYAKSPAQILLKWAVQQNIGIIPKSIKYEHLFENFNLFNNFKLTQNDFELLNTLNKKTHFCWNSDLVT